MRYMILFAALMVPLVAVSCGGSSTKPRPTTGTTSSPTARAGAASPTAAAPKTPAAASTPAPSNGSATAAEVTGIVGAVSVASRTIEINRLSGASVTKISIEPSTALRKAGGGTTTLAQIRPSDRIIARGRLNDRKDTLIAVEITVQDVVPGAQPGG
ncbi:MAG: hypothetical protein HY874_07845 [Chloroflexi bacterium]|nr:hypothetical protein [Chloroflexota bacterium]